MQTWEEKVLEREEGRKSGIEEGILKSLRNLMKNTQASADEAMAMLGIDEDNKAKYRSML